MTTATVPDASTPAAGLNPLKPRILHVAYHVHDIDRSLAFYVGVLGMKEQMRVDLSKTLHEVVLNFPDSKGGGVILMWDTARDNPPKPGDGYSRIVLMVRDVDAALKHVREHGTRIDGEPQSAGSMRWVMVQDPDGYVIELLQIAR
jgi:lactoylglutathione lyase